MTEQTESREREKNNMDRMKERHIKHSETELQQTIGSETPMNIT